MSSRTIPAKPASLDRPGRRPPVPDHSRCKYAQERSRLFSYSRTGKDLAQGARLGVLEADRSRQEGEEAGLQGRQVTLRPSKR